MCSIYMQSLQICQLPVVRVLVRVEVEGDSLSTATVAALSVSLTLLVYLPLGVAIGCFSMWCIMRKRQEGRGSEKREMVGVIYEEPALPPKAETVISLSENQAYGQVTSRNCQIICRGKLPSIRPLF